jgi:hypothetical protein
MSTASLTRKFTSESDVLVLSAEESVSLEPMLTDKFEMASDALESGLIGGKDGELSKDSSSAEEEPLSSPLEESCKVESDEALPEDEERRLKERGRECTVLRRLLGVGLSGEARNIERFAF